MSMFRRVVGVSDQCDWPPEAAERPAVSRSRVDCRTMTPAQVEAQMQAFKQQARPAHTVACARSSSHLFSIQSCLVVVLSSVLICVDFMPLSYHYF